jgi:acyl carrier protein
MASMALPLSDAQGTQGRVSDQIRNFICETFFVDAFADSDSFLQTGIIDSNGMMALVVFIEQEFSIRVEDAELLPENLDSLENLERFITRKRSGQA